ncbi:Ger(x)C family spore germination protein [Paenibacillus sacheonensis]|uniref:Ger(X)C family spore germination protein n=1 Tax=Paenibacillus sacheonensis TaxID=742054 RepID=A0A7X4YQF4_9BACL|nr:Ger(x)C family spore germination protein [Paenibacillus sacheonensis]MBM7566401.1 Ger(x)C family germination protein [Paenibacillus sacheonensis]NBC70600.1 Ger(x)C family spore germination protein [Paenibacillus sacheonensis]
MKRIAGAAVLLLGASLALTGCWDIKTVSDYNFVTAMGIEHKEGKYVIYVELMDFGDMGSQEQAAPGDRSKVWIGKSEGETLYDAINALYKTSQQNLYWDHLMAIVFSESTLKNEINAFFDSIPRFPQIRYNTWVFGTHEPINELFKYSTFFNLSPISNLLHNPKVLHNQLSSIPPIRLNTVLANAEEKGETDFVPRLTLKPKSWEDTKQFQTVLEMSGAYALHGGKAEQKLTEKQLEGVRWVNLKTRRAVLPISSEGKRLGTVLIIKPRKKTKIVMQSGKPAISLDLKFTGVVEEVVVPSKVKQFKEIAEKKIAEEVMQTYRAGITKQTDVYDFQQYLYRRNPKAYHSLTAGSSNNGFMLTEDSLRKVKVTVRIAHTGMYDMEP